MLRTNACYKRVLGWAKLAQLGNISDVPCTHFNKKVEISNVVVVNRHRKTHRRIVRVRRCKHLEFGCQNFAKNFFCGSFAVTARYADYPYVWVFKLSFCLSYKLFIVRNLVNFRNWIWQREYRHYEQAEKRQGTVPQKRKHAVAPNKVGKIQKRDRQVNQNQRYDH